jgi:hypothetical protein
MAVISSSAVMAMTSSVADWATISYLEKLGITRLMVERVSI